MKSSMMQVKKITYSFIQIMNKFILTKIGMHAEQTFDTNFLLPTFLKIHIIADRISESIRDI